MAADHVTDRSLLRFADEVKEDFAFLQPQGFRCVRDEATFVRFESSKFAINIFHGRESYEIGLAIEFPQSKDAYSFSEILRLGDSDQGEQYRNFATYTVDGVAKGVRQLADLCRKCVDAGILNDSELFSRLKLQRDKWARSYALEVQLEQARNESKDAWEKKDFAQVVKILVPLQEHLSSVDLSKLENAKKQANP